MGLYELVSKFLCGFSYNFCHFRKAIKQNTVIDNIIESMF